MLKTKSSKPRPLLAAAVSLTEHKIDALDLGSGALNDSLYLCKAGFEHVTAVDKTIPPPDLLQAALDHGISFVNSTFEAFEFPTSQYDLINAQYALPFNSSDSFEHVFSKMIGSLKPRGIFVGQLFGDRDTWNSPQRQMTFHTKDQALQILKSFEILKFEEEEKDGPTALGSQKHWHLFHIIAQKLS